jgi:uncharacterized glyoxalase superfamily protein PhnB
MAPGYALGLGSTPMARYPTVCPYLLYEDAAAALEWLTRVFGCAERMRMTADVGVVHHAEIEFARDGVVMLGQPADYRSPKALGTATAWVHVYVDDVDAHYERAQAAGAEIVQPPADQPYGDRRYDVKDLEGHPWSFATAGA